MGKPVVHYVKRVGYIAEAIINPPPVGHPDYRDINAWWMIDLWCDGYIQVQVSDSVKYTNHKPDVTCKNCLRALEKEVEPNE